MYSDPTRAVFNSFEILILYTIRQVFVLLTSGKTTSEKYTIPIDSEYSKWHRILGTITTSTT